MRCIVNSGDVYSDRTLVLFLIIVFAFAASAYACSRHGFARWFLSDFALAASRFKSFRRCRGTFFAGKESTQRNQPRGRLFFGDFLLAKQKKDTPAAGKHARREGEYQLKKITNPTCKTKSAASKESASATPKAFKTIAAQAKTIKKHKPACAPKKQPTPAAGKRARSEGERNFISKPAAKAK